MKEIKAIIQSHALDRVMSWSHDGVQA